ncbi:probable caffeine synthase MTL2 [Humulus lupulus]|uniref:probable caffeine synthase MTL2 n=1 Tax=Humulus lupulus TaxID=3486 RepID=UPI002B407335|nr:probable caffeine synthase MTL2 [Humulus lupulus]
MTSPNVALEAHLTQFQMDFTTFLKCRSKEMVIGGCMILTILGCIINNDPKHILEIVGRVLNDMVSEGIIEEESVDYFNIPMYSPNEKEIREVIEDDGSFWLHKLEVYEIAWDAGFSEAKGKTSNNTNINDDDDIDKHRRGEFVCGYMRAVMEPILTKQFGESVMDDLFQRFTQKVIESIANEHWQHVNLIVSLTKK